MQTGRHVCNVQWGQGITVRFNLVFFSATDVILLHIVRKHSFWCKIIPNFESKENPLNLDKELNSRAFL